MYMIRNVRALMSLSREFLPMMLISMVWLFAGMMMSLTMIKELVPALLAMAVVLVSAVFMMGFAMNARYTSEEFKVKASLAHAGVLSPQRHITQQSELYEAYKNALVTLGSEYGEHTYSETYRQHHNIAMLLLSGEVTLEEAPLLLSIAQDRGITDTNILKTVMNDMKEKHSSIMEGAL